MDLQRIAIRVGRGILYRRKLLFLLVFVPMLGVLMLTVYSLLSRSGPRFTASATVLIEVSPDRIPLFREFAPHRPVGVQLAILRSRSLSEVVLDSLPKATLDELRTNRYYVDYKLTLSNTLLGIVGHEPMVQSPREQALQELRNSRVSFAVRPHGIVEITADGSRPQIAMDLINTYIQVLTERTRSFNTQDTRVAREYLERQLAEATRQLRAAEEALAATSRARGGFTIPDTHQKVLGRLASLEAGLAELQATKQVTQIRLDALRGKVAQQPAAGRGGAAEPPPPPVNPQAAIRIKALQARLVQLETQVLELEGKYTPEHPRMVRVHDEIADSREKLQALLREHVQIAPASPSAAVAPGDHEAFVQQVLRLEEEVIVLNSQEGALQSAIADVKKPLVGLPAEQLEYNRLTRDADTKRQLHGMLVDRVTRVRTREQGEMQVVKVIDPAFQAPPRTSTRSPLLVAASVVASLMMAVAVAALVEYRAMPIEDDEDLERHEITALGTVPRLSRAGWKLAGLSALSTSRLNGLPNRQSVAGTLENGRPDVRMFHEAFRRIRSSLQVSTLDRPLRTILVTSTDEGEGKTTVVLNLAQAFWETGKRVVLADADFYRPTLQKLLHVSPREGLTDILAGRLSVQETLAPVAEGLWLSPRGSASAAESRGSLATPRVRDVLDEMSSQADIVIFDSSPLYVVPDNLLFASKVDAVVLVARAGRTSLHELVRTREMLQRAGANVVGAVINEARARRRDAYYVSYYRADGRDDRVR
jgi:polysaccharide biosynthesis transport protein